MCSAKPCTAACSNDRNSVQRTQPFSSILVGSMSWRNRAGAAALLATLAGAVLTAQSPAVRKLDQAWQAISQDDGDTAAAIFSEALQRNPRDANLYFGAGAA